MYAKILLDHIDCVPLLGEDYKRVGRVVVGTEPAPDEGLLQVRILDDDRELYYTCEADDEALESLLSFCMGDVGATVLQVMKEGEWEDTIS